MKRRAALALAAMLAAGALLPACGQKPDHAAVLELRRGNGSEPDSIDPQLARMEAAMTILRDCYEGLVSMAPDGKLIPGVAESWSTSDDGRIYTFRLRASARWSNGDRVVAEDFLAAFRRLVNPATASQYALMLEPVANAAEIVAGRKPMDALGVEVPDEATLVVHLAEPSPYFLAMLSHPSTFPVHRATLAANPKDFARPGTAVTNGAFVPLGLGDRLAYPRRAKRPLLERRGDEARRRALCARRRSDNRTHALPGRRPRRLLHPAAGRSRAPAEGYAGAGPHRADRRRLLLRPRARPAAVQGRAEITAGARDGRGSRRVDEAGARRRRTTRLRLGAARYCRLHAAAVRLGFARCRRAHHRGTAPLQGCGLFRFEAAPRRASHQQEPAARSHRARRDRDVEPTPATARDKATWCPMPPRPSTNTCASASRSWRARMSRWSPAGANASSSSS